MSIRCNCAFQLFDDTTFLRKLMSVPPKGRMWSGRGVPEVHIVILFPFSQALIVVIFAFRHPECVWAVELDETAPRWCISQASLQLNRMQHPLAVESVSISIEIPCPVKQTKQKVQGTECGMQWYIQCGVTQCDSDARWWPDLSCMSTDCEYKNATL